MRHTLTLTYSTYEIKTFKPGGLNTINSIGWCLKKNNNKKKFSIYTWYETSWYAVARWILWSIRIHLQRCFADACRQTRYNRYLLHVNKALIKLLRLRLHTNMYLNTTCGERKIASQTRIAHFKYDAYFPNVSYGLLSRKVARKNSLRIRERNFEKESDL